MAWALAAGASALVLAAVGAVAYYGSILHGAVEQATAREPDRAVVGVYVEAGDPAQSLEDTAGYAFGAAVGEPYGNRPRRCSGSGWGRWRSNPAPRPSPWRTA